MGLTKDRKFRFGKHAGETVDEVAQKDPKYISCAWKESSSFEERDEFDFFTTIAEAFGINVAGDTKKSNQVFRRHRITRQRKK